MRFRLLATAVSVTLLADFAPALPAGLLEVLPLTADSQTAGATGLTDSSKCEAVYACSRVFVTGVVESVDRERGTIRPEGFRLRISSGLIYANLQTEYLAHMSRVENDKFASWLQPGLRVTAIGTVTGQGAIFFPDTIIEVQSIAQLREVAKRGPARRKPG